VGQVGTGQEEPLLGEGDPTAHRSISRAAGDLAAIGALCRLSDLSIEPGQPHPSRSDLELWVEFQCIEPEALVKACFALERQLAAITGQSVDLVMADAIGNPYVCRDIDASKQLIVAAVT
jgi:predicted nucleotidyltransferase